jgi:hypothetical protein
VTHQLVAQSAELDNVGREHSFPVTLDDVGLILDQPETVGIDDEVLVVLASDGDGRPRCVLHILIATEAGADDEDVQAGEKALERVMIGALSNFRSGGSCH